MAEQVRVAVLISGRGSNMLALSEYKRRDPDRNYEIVLVASNVPAARGLVVAKRLGIRTWSKPHQGLSREAFDAALDAVLLEHKVELIALAGYMRLLSPAFVDKWEGRILNIHPSLLPLHKGLDTHQRAIMAGDAHGGCSVHLVTAELDSGPVLAQAQVRILPATTPPASRRGCSRPSTASTPRRSTLMLRRCVRIALRLVRPAEPTPRRRLVALAQWRRHRATRIPGGAYFLPGLRRELRHRAGP